MSQKDMQRSDWHRVLSKKYIAQDLLCDNRRAKMSLLQIEKVSKPLTINNITGCVCIADEGISWLQIAVERAHVWITVMYDPKDRFLQAYFDITNGNCFDNAENPTFEDMYLDVVLSQNHDIHILDADELETALAQGEINKQDYDAAWQHCRSLCDYLTNNKKQFLAYCEQAYQQLKANIN